MISSAWMRWMPMRIALFVLLISMGLAVFMGMRALQLTNNSRGALPVLPNPAALVAPSTPPALNVQAVVDRDLFAIDREGPTNAYLLPSEMRDDAGGAAFVPPRLQVLGIAMADGNKSFATCQVGTDRPTIVRVGDKLGPYTVRAIQQKRVTFALPSGATQTVAALTSGSGN